MVWIGLGSLLARSRGRDVLRVSLGVGVTVTAAHVSSVLLARTIGRSRPCAGGRNPALIPCPDGPAMPSDQAASSVAGAIVLGAVAPHAKPALLSLAAAIGAARVRVGVHHPTDVLAGGLLGSIFGRVGARLIARV